MKKPLITIALVTSFCFGAVNLQECQGCHGYEYKQHSLGMSKVIADMSADEIYDALIGYKNGTYGRSEKEIMQSQVKRYTPAELKDAAQEIVKFCSCNTKK